MKAIMSSCLSPLFQNETCVLQLTKVISIYFLQNVNRNALKSVVYQQLSEIIGGGGVGGWGVNLCSSYNLLPDTALTFPASRRLPATFVTYLFFL